MRNPSLLKLLLRNMTLLGVLKILAVLVVIIAALGVLNYAGTIGGEAPNALADSLSRTIPAYSKGYFVQRLHAIRNKALRGGPGSQNQRWRLESSPMTRSRSGTATCWSASSTNWRLGAVFPVMSFSVSRRNGDAASFSRKRLSR